MIIGITYGDSVFKNSRTRALESLKKYTDSSILFTEDDLKPFIEQHPKILYPGAKGGGFWLFKSIFLKHTLQNANDGDMVIWMDAGAECTSSLDVFYDIALQNSGFCLFSVIHKQAHYTKRDCFFYMGCDNEKYHNALNCDASIQMYIKNDTTVKFIDEYYKYCSDYRVVTDSPNECNLPNLPGFIDHRHDQSILANLCIKHNIQRFKEPTQWYHVGWSDDMLTDFEKQHSKRYEAVFNHHRERH